MTSLGRLDEAATTIERAIELYRELASRPDAQLGAALLNLARVYHYSSDPRAEQVIAEASEILSATLGTEHPNYAIALVLHGAILCDANQCALALEHLQRAEHIQSAAMGPDHPMIAFTLETMCDVLLKMGAYDRAIEPLERGIELASGPTPPLLRATLEFYLARSLWELRRDRKRAVKLAGDAKSVAEANNGPELSADITAWLSERDGS